MTRLAMMVVLKGKHGNFCDKGLAVDDDDNDFSNKDLSMSD